MTVMSPDHPPGRGEQGRKRGLSQEGCDNSLYLTHGHVKSS